MLHFHHPSGTVKESQISTYRAWNDKQLEEARKCEVICANCHTIEHCNWEPDWIEEFS